MPEYPYKERSASRFTVRLGRPQLPEEERMAVKLTISLTEQQHMALQQEQQQAGYRSLAAFVRERKLGFPGLG